MDYWQSIEKADDMLGPGGSRLVTFKNVGRWLDNSTFITMVGQAWIGTTQTQSSILEEVVRASVMSGKATTLALKVDKSIEGAADQDSDWLSKLREEVSAAELEASESSEFDDLLPKD